jgi:putative hemolysin
MDTTKQVLSKEDMQRMLGLKGGFGKAVAGLVIKVLEIDKVNRTQAKYNQLMGPDFAHAILEDQGVTYDIPEGQLDRIPAEGGFITVSNHHFGSIDGLILSDTVGRKRKDYKILTTFMLSLIPNLTESFLPVNNLGGKNDARSINSIRMALEHMQTGGGLGLFPAGEVGTWQKEGKKTAVAPGKVIEDKPWAPNIIRLIKKSGLPVVPIYFDGTNSNNFHQLGRIHPRLRTARLIHELFNKRGTHVKVRIGLPITPQEIAKFEDTEAFGQYLRNVTYALEASCMETPKRADIMHQEPVMDPVDPELVQKELAAIQKDVLFEVGDYRCYLASPQEIPNTMLEIARLREKTFRTVGEGTGTAKDTDIYDTYYRHLILWNVTDGKIAGAYRIGVGPEVLARPEGSKGFYTASLLEFREGLNAYLPKTMELGRSFIVEDYRKEVLPLKLLLSGILTAGANLPGMEYTMGPVSVSSDVPTFYKSLIYHYFLKNHSMENASEMVRPITPFTPDFLRVNPDQLLSGCKNVDEFDRLLSYISSGTVRLPVLFRKYASLGAKYLAFNIDTEFNTLDAFIIQWLGDMPENSFNSFARFLTPEKLEEIKSRLNR